MKRKLILAAATTAALAFVPAAGQAQSQNGASNPDNHMQQSSSQPADNGGQAQARAVSPQTLDNSDVKQIQQALDQKGFTVGKVDGIWGRETRSALEQFQRKQNLQAKGQLDQPTLSALGVDIASQRQGETTGSGPTGSGTSSDMSRPQPVPGDSNK
jgi:peptidoglycan hydrolase-like protein with peptidoglycan-binding domain